jgi:hypothetical protein
MQSNLLVETIKTGDIDRAKENLLFLIDTGLLDDEDGKIKAGLKEKTPVLPSAQMNELIEHPPELSIENEDVRVISEVKGFSNGIWRYSYTIVNIGNKLISIQWKGVGFSVYLPPKETAHAISQSIVPWTTIKSNVTYDGKSLVAEAYVPQSRHHQFQLER